LSDCVEWPGSGRQRVPSELPFRRDDELSELRRASLHGDDPNEPITLSPGAIARRQPAHRLHVSPGRKHRTSRRYSARRQSNGKPESYARGEGVRPTRDVLPADGDNDFIDIL